MEKMLYDKFVISEKIKAMTKEEKLAEIKRLEEEAANEKQRLLQSKTHKTEVEFVLNFG